MIDYRAGVWGFHVAFGINGSLAPRSLAMAIPNAALTFLVGTFLRSRADDFPEDKSDADDTAKSAATVISTFTAVMIFVLYNRSRTSYNRWWEGGTLLQKTRGEWFNAYSSIMAFTSTKPEHEEQVAKYTHLLARLMSLLMCCGLQQVSPNRDRPFEIIDLNGIEPDSMEFLNSAPDKVEIILQWIQRSMVLHMQTGVLPVAPPILSRAFQEVSRGIVNLQNARKIADFPFPYPLAQVSMLLQLLHFAATPIAASLAFPRAWAVAFSFSSIFVLWCVHFNALDLEFPFGTRVNDLPMNEMQQDWNKSICTLLRKRATRPPTFEYDPEVHANLSMAMSDASTLYVPTTTEMHKQRRTVAMIKVDPSGGIRKQIDQMVDAANKATGIAQIRISHTAGTASVASKVGFKTEESEESVGPAVKSGTAPPAKKEGPDIPSSANTDVPRQGPSASSTPPSANGPKSALRGSRDSPGGPAQLAPCKDEEKRDRIDATGSPSDTEGNANKNVMAV